MLVITGRLGNWTQSVIDINCLLFLSDWAIEGSSIFSIIYCLSFQADWVIEGYRPPDEWPQEGRIDVQGLGIRYRDGQPFVLKNVTFQVDSGEKVSCVQ